MHSNPVAIFWDYGTTPVKKGVSGHHIVKALREVGLTYGRIKSFRAYIDYDCQRRASFMTFRRELHSSGVSLVDCPSSQKDLADKTIIVDMMALAWDHPPPYTIVLATGDSDLSYALAILRFRGYKIIVVCPSDSSLIVMQSDSSINWNRRVLGLEDEGDDGSTSSETSSIPASSSKKKDPVSHNNKISGRHDCLTNAAAPIDTPNVIEVEPAINSSTSKITPGNERQTHENNLPEEALSQTTSFPLRTGIARDTSTNDTANSTKKTAIPLEHEAKAERKGASVKANPPSTSPPSLSSNAQQPSSVSNQGNDLLQGKASVSISPPAFSLDSTARMPQVPNPAQEHEDHVSFAESSSSYSFISQPVEVTSSQGSEGLVAARTLTPPGHLEEGATAPPPHPSAPPHTPIPILSSEPTIIGIMPGPSNFQPLALGSLIPLSTSNPQLPTASRPGPSTPSVPVKKKLPERYNALVKCLQNHRAQGQYAIDPSIIAAELKSDFWKKLGHRHFRQYARKAIKDGIITQNPDQLKHILLRPEWYDVQVP